MAIDTRLEEKLGFDRVRKIVSDRCSTDYAADRVATEQFSSDAESEGKVVEAIGKEVVKGGLIATF